MAGDPRAQTFTTGERVQVLRHLVGEIAGLHGLVIDSGSRLPPDEAGIEEAEYLVRIDDGAGDYWVRAGLLVRGQAVASEHRDAPRAHPQKRRMQQAGFGWAPPPPAEPRRKMRQEPLPLAYPSPVRGQAHQRGHAATPSAAGAQPYYEQEQLPLGGLTVQHGLPFGRQRNPAPAVAPSSATAAPAPSAALPDRSKLSGPFLRIYTWMSSVLQTVEQAAAIGRDLDFSVAASFATIGVKDYQRKREKLRKLLLRDLPAPPKTAALDSYAGNARDRMIGVVAEAWTTAQDVALRIPSQKPAGGMIGAPAPLRLEDNLRLAAKSILQCMTEVTSRPRYPNGHPVFDPSHHEGTWTMGGQARFVPPPETELAARADAYRKRQRETKPAQKAPSRASEKAWGKRLLAIAKDFDKLLKRVQEKSATYFARVTTGEDPTERQIRQVQSEVEAARAAISSMRIPYLKSEVPEGCDGGITRDVIAKLDAAWLAWSQHDAPGDYNPERLGPRFWSKAINTPGAFERARKDLDFAIHWAKGIADTGIVGTKEQGWS